MDVIEAGTMIIGEGMTLPQNETMSIDKLKNILGNDPDINDMIDNAVQRGFLDENCQSTEKNEALYPHIQSYCEAMVGG